jgi:hypothetical protein
MDSATFREWLADRGCHFSPHESERHGHGQAAVTVHREGHTADLPLVGSHKAIDPETVRDICQALDLDWAQLPGPMSRA